MRLNHCRLLVITVAIQLGAVYPVAAQDSATAGAVVVTGAPSGIGRKITERLASRGYWVYAGARTPQEIEELNALHNVQAIRLDFVLNVNLFGPARVTKAFAPLLLDAKGRVVNISSLNGVVASPMIGAYSMSKHGIEAYSDALGAELAPFGVKVLVIEPGNYGTSIGRNMLARTDTSLVKGSRFERQWRSALTTMASFDRNPPPDAVADAVVDALSSANPKPRYLVVPAANQATIVLRKLMQTIAELNSDQPYSVDRDTLVKMLDEALARAHGGQRQRPPE